MKMTQASSSPPNFHTTSSVGDLTLDGYKRLVSMANLPWNRVSNSRPSGNKAETATKPHGPFLLNHIVILKAACENQGNAGICMDISFTRNHHMECL
ncbi:hypothetical protein AVEN_211529-1 [Araneus ventricosus]|uniref:Uncharacterized protein n=1 Tax=Araneus ventricosus TaxID=182803 RepID=A0A4Y2LNX5_ARAVE|nr:hypothetical protein AVEN_211529-1 [Araneus ventricosus]